MSIPNQFVSEQFAEEHRHELDVELPPSPGQNCHGWLFGAYQSFSMAWW